MKSGSQVSQCQSQSCSVLQQFKHHRVFIPKEKENQAHLSHGGPNHSRSELVLSPTLREATTLPPPNTLPALLWSCGPWGPGPCPLAQLLSLAPQQPSAGTPGAPNGLTFCRWAIIPLTVWPCLEHPSTP